MITIILVATAIRPALFRWINLLCGLAPGYLVFGYFGLHYRYGWNINW